MFSPIHQPRPPQISAPPAPEMGAAPMSLPPLDLALDLSAGPSNAQGGKAALKGEFGDFNFKGSSRRGGLPIWAIVGGVAVLGFLLLRGKK